MSYILDALKKSDRERQEETPSHLQPLYEMSRPARDVGIFQRRRWPWLLLFGLLLFGGWAKWADWSERPSVNRQAPEVEASRQTTSTPTETAARQEPADHTPAPTAESVASEQPSSPRKIQGEWFDDWLQQLPKKDYSLLVEKSPPADEADEEGVPPVVSLTAAQSKKITRIVKIKRDREKVLLATQEDRGVDMVVIQQPAQVQTVIGQPQPVPGGKPKSALPYLRDLPPEVQAQVPKLQFAGHAYAEAPSQRLIVINGMIMREGEQIDAETKLTEITWEGVVIDRKGVRFQVRCY